MHTCVPAHACLDPTLGLKYQHLKLKKEIKNQQLPVEQVLTVVMDSQQANFRTEKNKFKRKHAHNQNRLCMHIVSVQQPVIRPLMWPELLAGNFQGINTSESSPADSGFCTVLIYFSDSLTAHMDAYRCLSVVLRQ